MDDAQHHQGCVVIDHKIARAAQGVHHQAQHHGSTPTNEVCVLTGEDASHQGAEHEGRGSESGRSLAHGKLGDGVDSHAGDQHEEDQAEAEVDADRQQKMQADQLGA